MNNLTEQEKKIIIWSIRENAKYHTWILTELKGTSFENIKCAGDLLLIYDSIIQKLEK